MPIQNFELCFQPGVIIKANDGGASLITGNTYSIIDNTSGITYCATLVGGPTGSGPVYDLGTLFDSCFECSQSIPSSANTEYTLCLRDCSGNTISLSMPHPVATNEYGNEVTQLNAVQLGGQNGLYN